MSGLVLSRHQLARTLGRFLLPRTEGVGLHGLRLLQRGRGVRLCLLWILCSRVNPGSQSPPSWPLLSALHREAQSRAWSSGSSAFPNPPSVKGGS